MKKSQLKEIIKECIHEARMGGKRVEDVPIYDRNRKKILGYVDQRATSIGASKKVGAKACLFGKVDGKNCWIVKEATAPRDYKKEYADFHGTKQHKLDRAQRNSARRELESANRVHKGDRKDVDHRNPIRSGGGNGRKNLRVRTRSANRAENGH